MIKTAEAISALIYSDSGIAYVEFSNTSPKQLPYVLRVFRTMGCLPGQLTDNKSLPCNTVPAFTVHHLK